MFVLSVKLQNYLCMCTMFSIQFKPTTLLHILPEINTCTTSHSSDCDWLQRHVHMHIILYVIGGPFPNFLFKCLHLWNHSSYELELWHEYSPIILLHLQLQGIPSPPHFLCGQGTQVHLKIASLCLTLAARRSGQ